MEQLLPFRSSQMQIEILVIYGLKREPQIRDFANTYQDPLGVPLYDHRVIEAILIQSRLVSSFLHCTVLTIYSGVEKSKNQRCSICAGDPQTKGLFIGCVKLEGYYGGACANCKRQDRGSTCEVRDIGKDELRVALEEELVKHTSKRGRITQKPKSYIPIDIRRTRRKPSPEL